MNEFTAQEFEAAKNDILEGLITKNKGKSEKPIAYLIAGQPGAGKTTLADIISQYHDRNIIFVSGDNYRKDHPHYSDFLTKYGDDAVIHTQNFAGKMTEAIIDTLSKDKYNLIIEGTLRTTEVPQKTCELLHDRGYSVNLDLILVRPEISYLSTLKRYEVMKEMGSVPRHTPKEHHDKVVAAIPDNLNKLYKMGIFDNIQIFNRNGDILYNQTKTPELNPADMFNKEFGRILSQNEKQKIMASFQPYIKPEIICRTLTPQQKDLCAIDHCFIDSYNSILKETASHETAVLEASKKLLANGYSVSLIKSIINKTCPLSKGNDKFAVDIIKKCQKQSKVQNELREQNKR